MSYRNFLIKAKENLNQSNIFCKEGKPQYYIYDEKLGWKIPINDLFNPISNK